MEPEEVNPFAEVQVLLAAAVFTIATKDFTDASVILFVITVNTTVGVIQEVKAERAITALASLTAPDARVIRDGTQREVPAADLVVGDLLVLAEGDIVPADADLVQAAGLLVDEAALTGESAPVDKSTQADAVVSAGTVVLRGRGRGASPPPARPARWVASPPCWSPPPGSPRCSVAWRA